MFEVIPDLLVIYVTAKLVLLLLAFGKAEAYRRQERKRYEERKK